MISEDRVESLNLILLRLHFLGFFRLNFLKYHRLRFCYLRADWTLFERDTDEVHFSFYFLGYDNLSLCGVDYGMEPLFLMSLSGVSSRYVTLAYRRSVGGAETGLV